MGWIYQSQIIKDVYFEVAVLMTLSSSGIVLLSLHVRQIIKKSRRFRAVAGLLKGGVKPASDAYTIGQQVAA